MSMIRRQMFSCYVLAVLQLNSVATAIRLARHTADGTSNDTSDACTDDKNLQEGQEYFVDNSILQAQTKGMGYRLSKDLKNVDRSHFALWGTTIRGTEEGDGWLKVAQCYLPMSLKGTKVLIPSSGQSAQTRSAAEETRATPTSPTEAARPEAVTKEPNRAPAVAPAALAPVPLVGAPTDSEVTEAAGAPVTITNSRQCNRGDAVAIPAVPEALPYFVDNSKLKASTKGMGFRFSKDMRDVDKTSISAWGSTVLGIDAGDGWLQVGDCFLPMKMKGTQVLTLVPAVPANVSSNSTTSTVLNDVSSNSTTSTVLNVSTSEATREPNSSSGTPETEVLVVPPVNSTNDHQDGTPLLEETANETQQNRTKDGIKAGIEPDGHDVHKDDGQVLDPSSVGCKESLQEREARIANLSEALAKAQANTSELRELLNASETAGVKASKRLEVLQANILEGRATLGKLIRSLAEELDNQTTFLEAQNSAGEVLQDTLPGVGQVVLEAAGANESEDPLQAFAALSHDLEKLTRQAMSSGNATVVYLQGLRRQLEAEHEAKQKLVDDEAAQTDRFAKEKAALEQELETTKRNASEMSTLRDNAASQVTQLTGKLAELQANHRTDNMTSEQGKEQEAAEVRQRLSDLQERLLEEIS